MSRSRHTEAQMIAALKQLEAGRKAEDVAREVGVSKHTTTGEFTSEWRIRRQSLWGSARHGRGDAGRFEGRRVRSPPDRHVLAEATTIGPVALPLLPYV